GGFATIEKETITLTGLIASLDGKTILREKLSGPATEAEKTGVRLAENLLAAGGKAILDEVYKNEIS
ncbi:MAG: hydroxymethylbilane synthase, partial [Candidatus Electrothrix sp. AR1]|nr:hydroxymethylbilane synthase [Candidatus Electrothrix sp. AR1]